MYLVLDESGDLGFDFVTKKPSKYFTICILVIKDPTTYYAIRHAIKKTLRRKVNKGGRAKHLRSEIKAADTGFNEKKHFYQQVANLEFSIYALTLNKKKELMRLTQEKDRVYNFIARLVMDKIPFEQATGSIQLIVDKSKGRAAMREFDTYVIRQLQGRINPKSPLFINHEESHTEPAIQAVDLFAWGIFRRYEREDSEWYDLFKGKVVSDEVYSEEKI
jgi:hypothetical protein